MNKQTFRAYLELTKPRILMLVLITVIFGYFLAGQGLSNPLTLFWVLLGTALTCGGSGALNHYLERDVDCKMLRTKNRPLVRGDVEPAEALGFGLALVLIGTVVLCWQVNLLTAFLALLTAFLYVLVYTPLKRRTWLNTMIGAIPGALPPMGGWTAVTDSLDPGAWILFGILFCWQHPHFYAISWMYRDDYERGGFQMLSVVDREGKTIFLHILGFLLLLIPISLMPIVIGSAGWVYLIGTLLPGLVLLSLGISLLRTKTIRGSKILFTGTIIYLPILMIISVVDVFVQTI